MLKFAMHNNNNRYMSAIQQNEMKDRLYELLYKAHDGDLQLLTIIATTLGGETIHHQIRRDDLPPRMVKLRLVAS